MENFAIKIENVSKIYGDKTVLKDINLVIKKGEKVGIIGRNGAGKSTLLKIMSGMVKPSNGRVLLKGSYLSILDVGAGLHPDLTGRENIDLFIKMNHFEKNEFKLVAEIIEFSELGLDIEKPLKTYSNGMYLRLAFSIFAFLESEILILDEVFFVGDDKFKKKSRKLIRDSNRTIIVVSHDLNEVLTTCDRVIYIDNAIINDSIDINKVLNQYLNESNNLNGNEKLFLNNKNLELGYVEVNNFFGDCKNHFFELIGIKFKRNGELTNHFKNEDEIEIEVSLKRKEKVNFQIIILVSNYLDNVLFYYPLFSNQHDNENLNQYCTFSTKLPSHLLNVGRYFINIVLSSDWKKVKTWNSLAVFEVELDDITSNQPWSNIPALLMPKLETKTTFFSNTLDTD